MVSVNVQEISVAPSTFPYCGLLHSFDDDDLLGCASCTWFHMYGDTWAMIQFSRDTVYYGSFDTIEYNLT